MYGCTVLLSIDKKESNYYQKLLEIEKGIVHEVARGDKHYLKQSADRKAQISLISETNAFLICASQSADCFRYCMAGNFRQEFNFIAFVKAIFLLNLIPD